MTKDIGDAAANGQAFRGRGKPIDGKATTPPRAAYRLLHEMVTDCLRPIGSRLSTGIQTLDDASRGGVPMGHVIVLAGAPGASKTTFAVWLAVEFEQQGCAFVYLAADEPAPGILVRLGQLAGFARDDLESEGIVGDAVRANFARTCIGRPVLVIDPDLDDAVRTIEDAEQALLKLAGDRPRVLVIDSIQTAQCAAADGAETLRERIGAIVATLKLIAKRGTLVIAMSEMSRAGYRSGDRGSDISALAASKESGSIEYGVSMLLGLRSVKGEPGLIDVEVAKNRLGGSKPDLRLRQDFERASFEEVATPTQNTDHDKCAKKHDVACERIRRCLRERHDIQAQRVLVRVAGGAAAQNNAACRDMLDRAEIVKVDGCFRLSPDGRKKHGS